MQLEKSAIESGPHDFSRKIRRAASILKAERQRKIISGGTVNGGIVEIGQLENIAVISDLHGDIGSLFGILSEINYQRFLSNPMNKLVFLGDYVDRGSNSIGVMYSVCHLKAEYPDSVILMRGNHEAPAEFPFSSHDLPYKLQERFSAAGREVYQELLSIFELLTLATLVRKELLLVHGGLPTENATLEKIAAAQENHNKSRVLEELLWNDPRQINSESGWEKSRRGFGRHFGASISQKVLQTFGVKVIVRGHEPCQGFRLDHNNMVMTLFSCTEAYPKFKAAYLLLESNQLEKINHGRDLVPYVRFPE